MRILTSFVTSLIYNTIAATDTHAYVCGQKVQICKVRLVGQVVQYICDP